MKLFNKSYFARLISPGCRNDFRIKDRSSNEIRRVGKSYSNQVQKPQHQICSENPNSTSNAGQIARELQPESLKTNFRKNEKKDNN